MLNDFDTLSIGFEFNRICSMFEKRKFLKQQEENVWFCWIIALLSQSEDQKHCKSGRKYHFHWEALNTQISGVQTNVCLVKQDC